jgi:hypothetical protein
LRLEFLAYEKFGATQLKADHISLFIMMTLSSVQSFFQGGNSGLEVQKVHQSTKVV